MKKNFDPEKETQGIHKELYWMEEALWDYLHNPTDENLRVVGGAAECVIEEARRVAFAVKVGHEERKRDTVDGEES